MEKGDLCEGSKRAPESNIQVFGQKQQNLQS